jgi:hypothetical protein
MYASVAVIPSTARMTTGVCLWPAAPWMLLDLHPDSKTLTLASEQAEASSEALRIMRTVRHGEVRLQCSAASCNRCFRGGYLNRTGPFKFSFVPNQAEQAPDQVAPGDAVLGPWWPSKKASAQCEKLWKHLVGPRGEQQGCKQVYLHPNDSGRAPGEPYADWFITWVRPE